MSRFHDGPWKSGISPKSVAKSLPEWVCYGALVNYHSIIGGPVTKSGCRVESAPHLLGGHTWCVMLEGVSGCVAIAALSKFEEASC